MISLNCEQEASDHTSVTRVSLYVIVLDAVVHTCILFGQSTTEGVSSQNFQGIEKSYIRTRKYQECV